MPRGQVGPADDVAEAREEPRLERGDGQPAAVRRAVHPVGGEPPGERAAERRQPVRERREGDREPRPPARSLAGQQGGDDLAHRGERAAEVGQRNGRESRRGLRERARVAEVVQVVPDPRRVRAVPSEAGQRAVDDPLGQVVGTDSEPRGDARPEALQHHVGACAESSAELRLVLEVTDDRFLARVQQRVPGRLDLAQRIARRRLEPDDAGAEPEQLAARERAREVPRQVDHQHARERFHRSDGSRGQSGRLADQAGVQ